MRHYLDKLQLRGDLAIVDKSVDPRFEAAGVASRLQAATGQAVLFTQVRGSALPLVMNVYSDHDRLREIIRCGKKSFCERLDEEMNLLASFGCATDEDVVGVAWVEGVLADLPVVAAHDPEGSWGLAAGVLLTADRSGGLPHLSPQTSMRTSDSALRMRVAEGSAAAVGLRHGQAIEAAILISAAPEVFLASRMPSAMAGNRLALAAAMRGGPLRMRKCKTLALTVPASTDVVIEGRLLPVPGDSARGSCEAVFEVSHVGWREGAVFHAFIPGSKEDGRPFEAGAAAYLYRQLKQQVPGVMDVCCQPAMNSTIIKIAAQYEGHGSQALLAALGASQQHSKLCVVVDDDIDIYDMNDVMWAFATRARPDIRSFIVANVPGPRGDTHKDNWGRLALDATKPWGREAAFERRQIVGEHEMSLADYLAVPGTWSNRFGA